MSFVTILRKFMVHIGFQDSIFAIWIFTVENTCERCLWHFTSREKKRPFFHSTTIACKSHPNDSQTYVYLYIGNVSYLSFETREIEGERWEGMEVKSFVFYRYYRSTMYFMLSRWIECVHLSFKGEKIKENFET